MADAKPGPFGLWRQMRAKRKARESMTAEMPPDIVAEITADAAGEHDPEVLREFLRDTPHPFALTYSPPWEWVCVCGLGPLNGVHDNDSLLDTRAFLDGTGGARERAARALAAERTAQPVRGRSESLREFLQRTPHHYARDWMSLERLCVCSLGPLRSIHFGDDLLDTRAHVTARLEEIRAGWPAPEAEAVAEDIPRETTVAEPAQSPGGAPVYLVARAEGGVIIDTTHTTAMDLETARREAKAHGVSSVREWFPVELRRVSGG